MKRIWALLLGVVLSVSLTACAENNLDQMYIEEAQLTEEEKNIAELLGLNQEYRLYDNLADGLRIAIQSEHNNGSTSYFKESENDITGMGYATSVLSDKQEIVYDQEIPLVIQIITSKNEVHSYVVDYFFQPEEYEKYDYEYVYAITVLFSQKPVSELAN